MILIPEIEKVVILVPRTGTRALIRAIAARYPQAMRIYRHMEADGVPQGYDRWEKLGVVRDPVDRLYSLYKYLQQFGINHCQEHDPAYTRSMRESVSAPFGEWIVANQLVFTSPYDSAGLGRFFPGYTCRHPLPENRKSQFVYLRPDLGTRIYRYSDVDRFHAALDVDPPRINGTDNATPPPLSAAAVQHVARWFAWDLQASDQRVSS